MTAGGRFGERIASVAAASGERNRRNFVTESRSYIRRALFVGDLSVNTKYLSWKLFSFLYCTDSAEWVITVQRP